MKNPETPAEIALKWQSATPRVPIPTSVTCFCACGMWPRCAALCQNPMRVVAVIDDPRVVERILRHVAVWHDPPRRPPMACRVSRLSARQGISGAVLAIGNEPGRSILPVV